MKHSQSNRQLCRLALTWRGGLHNLACPSAVPAVALSWRRKKSVHTTIFCSSNVFSASIGRSSGPVAFPFFIRCIAYSTSSVRMFCPVDAWNWGIGRFSVVIIQFCHIFSRPLCYLFLSNKLFLFFIFDAQSTATWLMFWPVACLTFWFISSVLNCFSRTSICQHNFGHNAIVRASRIMPS